MIRLWFKHFRERWANWCGDREMEMAVRQCLSSNGYYGRSAKLRNVRIVAIQRPGWVQIYRFEATARVCGESPPSVNEDDSPVADAADHELYGLVRDDGRKRSEVRFFTDPDERRVLFAQWSTGLLCLRGSQGLA